MSLRRQQGLQLLATSDLRLQNGDTLVLSGKPMDLAEVEAALLA